MLDEHDGIKLGDFVSIDGSVHPQYTRAKIMRIYRSLHRKVKFVVKVADGTLLDIGYGKLEKLTKPCKCDIFILMRVGCQCCGY